YTTLSRYTHGLGQLGDLGLQLLLTRRGPRLPRRQAGPAGLEERPLPVPDRLLGHLRPPGGLGDGDLAGQDRQHDPGLLLGRNDGGLAMNDQTPHRSGPQATGPATKSDARQPGTHNRVTGCTCEYGIATG